MNSDSVCEKHEGNKEIQKTRIKKSMISGTSQLLMIRNKCRLIRGWGSSDDNWRQAGNGKKSETDPNNHLQSKDAVPTAWLAPSDSEGKKGRKREKARVFGRFRKPGSICLSRGDRAATAGKCLGSWLTLGAKLLEWWSSGRPIVLAFVSPLANLKVDNDQLTCSIRP